MTYQERLTDQVNLESALDLVITAQYVCGSYRMLSCSYNKVPHGWSSLVHWKEDKATNAFEFELQHLSQRDFFCAASLASF